MNDGLGDELAWDRGNTEHAVRHGIARQEIDAMYASGEWIVVDDPSGRVDQARLIGFSPAARLITVAVEWLSARRMYRPISAWASTPGEQREWARQMFGEE